MRVLGEGTIGMMNARGLEGESFFLQCSSFGFCFFKALRKKLTPVGAWSSKYLYHNFARLRFLRPE